jgi:hypothetical protein
MNPQHQIAQTQSLNLYNPSYVTIIHIVFQYIIATIPASLSVKNHEIIPLFALKSAIIPHMKISII